MKKSSIDPMPGYYRRYIDLVEDIELMSAFENSVRQITGLNIYQLNKFGNERYAPGKWTIKQILQHLTDWERILGYRTLLIARKDDTLPTGHDQDFLAMNSNVDNRTVETILNELKAVRFSTIQLFKGFDEQTLGRRGICWQDEISVLGMGFLIVGHQAHHLKIIREKYLP